jgi:PfaB family protein
MGHLLTAAGMTGLFKVLLAIEKELIPPNINMQEPIDSEKGWLTGEQIIVSPTQWQGEHKQAGINSFGFGGTNAHMIINSYVPPQPPQRGRVNSPKQQINVTQQINNTLSYSPPLGGAGGDNLKCPLAITGMDVHFGNCTNLADFYQTIYDGKQHFRALPPKRWKGFEQNKALLEKYGFQNGLAPKGNYIEDFEIDLLRYKIQPKEAETLEPQQALILKVADNAIKDAQLKEGQNVAVIIAMQPELAIHHYLARWDSEWQLNEALEKAGIQLNEEEKEKVIALCKNLLYHREGDQTPSQHTSFVGNIMASRIAALWDFTGPAFTITNGDDSVLRALEVAQHLLANGEVEAVVVGGVDFSGGLENVLLNQLKEAVNQSDNPSLNLNINDKGWLIGEGAGAVVIKKSEDATKEEKVYGVIEEIGEKVKTEGAAYYELCARGFEADKHELTDLLQQSQNEVVALGSVKANIGHTFAASGIASLIKTALCLHYKFIPAIPNWEEPKSDLLFPPRPPKGGEKEIGLAVSSPPLGGLGGDNPQTPYYFPTKSFPWIKPNSTGKRKALIHNVCDTKIVMREGDSVHSPKALMLQQFAPKLFLLKGDNQADLLLQLNALEVAIEGRVPFSELAKQFWAKAKDKKQQYCIALLAENVQLLLQEIQRFKKLLPNAFAKNQLIQTPQGSYFNPNPTGHTGKLSFIYPGSATAYEGLGADVFQLFPDVFQYYEGILPSLDNFIASEYIYPRKISKNEEKPSVQTNAIAMMSVGVFFSTVYTHILREYFKVEPSATLGYSMGECSSMYYALGIWGSDNASIFQNSPIFQNRFAGNLELLAEEWQMTSEEAKMRWVSLVLLTSKEKVLPLIQSKEKVYLSFINTDNELIISGDKTECYAIAKELGCINVEVPFQNVIHHDFCNKEREGLIEMHNFAIQDEPKIDFYSSIKLGKLSLVSTELAENSTEVCCRKVDFPQLIRTVFEDKVNSFVEIGANSTCTAWIKDILKSENHLAVSVDKKGVSFAQTLLSALGQIISNGFSADISGLYLDNSISVKEKTFLKKIMVGGERILEAIQKKKVSVTRVFPKRELVAISEVIQSSVVPMEQSLSTDKNISTMNENIVSTNTSAAGTIGENGLLRHDFSTGKHLEGKTIIFTQKDLEEFAEGKIANVFGEEYAIIDTYKRRVMLPMYPYLLVSRVTELKGKRGEFKPSKMQTEYDIPYNAWFSTDGQIPWAVSVESGQCDLMLISYLGIDFQAKGEYVYRLLDCTLTFLDDLPFEGQTLRYDISINSFVRNGNNLLFFFSYECFVQDRMVLKMDGGCAGFFTDGQLSEGNGVVYTNSELEALKNVEKKTFTPLLETKKRAFTKDDLRHLIKGDMHLCFEDESYFANGRNPSLRLPDEQILMIDEIVSVDLQGGAYGLGEIIAEKNLSPTDWFFPCHFRDDEVLAGSLQAEGGGNLLRFFMLMLGLQRLTKDARYQPIFDLPQKVRCRKQVIPSQDTKLIYKLVIKEIGLTPNPYVIGDLEIISNGIITVHFENLGLQLREKTDAKYLNKRSVFEPSPKSEGALLNEAQISTFALGRLSDAFGEDFKVYDHRKVSRQPNTDLQLISRVLKIEGTRGSFAKPSTIYAEYDVPQDAWYYTQNASRTMPYSVLMEIALQPCGLLGAYLGSTLRFPDQNLYFRNLDGEGEFFDLPEGTDFSGQTIHNKSVLLSSVALGGVILQKYTFELSVNGRIFYKGNSSFGFFPKESLAQQAGLDNGAEIAPWYETQQLTPKDYFQFKLDSVYAKMKLFKAAPNKPHFHLSGDQLQFVGQWLNRKRGW